MKKLKKILAVILCLVMIQAPVQIFTQTTEVQAAVKKQVKYNKNNGRYYYYENGKRVNVKNKWITVSKQRYYFGSGGYAYAAPREDGVVYNIVTKEIGSKVYGFDSRGRMVKNGLYYRADGVCFYFNSRGEYSQSATKKYRALTPKGHPAVQKKSASYARKLLDKLSKPKKVENLGSSCVIMNGTDYRAIYAHYELQYTRDNKTKEAFVTGIWPR